MRIQPSLRNAHAMMHGRDRCPTRIHQTWKTADVPHEVYKAEWLNSWRTHHPMWTYKLWTDDDNRRFIAERYPWFLSVYDGYPAGIYRADAVRYFILYEYGGLYADLDFVCLKPFDSLLKGGGPIAVFGALTEDPTCEHRIPNALMASSPRHPIMWRIMTSLAKTAHLKTPESATGPVMLTRTLISLLGRWGSMGVRVLPPNAFYPIDWRAYGTGSAKYPRRSQAFASPAEEFPDSYAVTYWTHYW